MLAAPSSSLEAAVAALLVAAGLLALGYLLADALCGSRDWDGVIRAGLALPGLMAFVLALMLAHVVTGGAMLSRPGVTRAVFAGAGVALVAWKTWATRRRPRPPAPGRAPYVALIAAVVLAVALWGYPTTELLPLDHGWDTDRDAGLASQLLNGEPLPSGTVTGDIPNDYPWLHHAALALMANLMPGGRALHALTPMLFVQTVGAVLALFAAGWELTRRWYGAGATALFGALSGGFGYLVSRRPAVVLNPRGEDGEAAMRFIGDMLFVRSYNMSFNNLAPAFPRDLGFALLSATVLLLIVAFGRRSVAALIASGLVGGTVGLTTGESVFVAVGTAVALMLWPPRAREADVRGRDGVGRTFRRWQIGAGLVLPALAMWSLWLGPLIVNYFRFDGFRPSVNRLVRLEPWGFAGAWGMAAVLGVVGLVVALRRPRPGTHVILCVLVVSAGLVLASNIVPMLTVEGFQTLGRDHRYWPLTYLPVALLAGLGACALIARLVDKSRVVPLAVGALVVALSIPSPLLASVALPRVKDDLDDVERALTGKRTMLNLVAPSPGMRCVAAVHPDLSHPVFAYTGYRLVLFRWGRALGPAAAHIRWRDIYERIPNTRERLAALGTLLDPVRQRAWEAEADRWGVDVVVVPGHGLPRWMRVEHRVAPTRYEGAPVSVVWIDGCG